MNTKKPSLPGFNAETSLYRTGNQYRLAGCSVHAASAETIVPQLPWRCWLYASLCLAITEDPIAADYCWWDFANRCGGGGDA
jgi:hypothetical protein